MKLLLAVLLLLYCVVGSSVAAEQYTIREGDTLNITVAGEPNLTKTTVVRPDGQVAVGLVGDVKAAGLTPEQFRTNIEKALTKYIRRPDVSVEVTGYDTAASVNVLGGVRQPGRYPLRGRTMITDAIALAGGSTERAKLGEVVVTRESAAGSKKTTVDVAKIVKSGDTGQNLVLQPGDTVYVPEKRARPDWLRIVGAAVSIGVLLTR